MVLVLQLTVPVLLYSKKQMCKQYKLFIQHVHIVCETSGKSEENEVVKILILNS
jgi:hypothetical protein